MKKSRLKQNTKRSKKDIFKNREKSNTYQHKFSHYCFECELHPDDSKDEIETKLRKVHL